MIIKKYVVDQMQQAVQQIKKDLGSDAIIVSTQKVRGSGLIGLLKRRLEVTAVLDEVKEIPASPKREQISQPEPTIISIQPTRTITDQVNPIVVQAADLVRTESLPQAAEPSVEPLLPTEFKPLLEDAVMKSLEEQEKERLLAMLEQQLEKTDNAVDECFNSRWLEILTGIDIDREIAKNLLSSLEQVVNSDAENKDELAKITLTDKVTELLKPVYANVKQPKFIAFIGPPGVGKTTTLVKLATKFKVLEGKKIALITVYTYRYGTADQLKIYGDAIDVPVEVVMTPAELKQAVERHADKDYVLIDTVGRTSKNTGQVLELKGFLEAINEPKQICLVLAASTKDRDLFRTIKDFQIARYNSYIFTKVDETETLGSLLNVVVKTGVPVLYTTDGQTIPDDIENIQPQKLAQLTFRSVDLHEGYDY